jgi:hypothetical protein
MPEKLVSDPPRTPTAMRQRLVRAVPPVKSTIAGALLWGCGMALSLLVGLEIIVGGLTSHRMALTGLYFAGGVLAFPVAIFLIRLLALRQSAEIRFSAAFVSLTATTIGGTAGLFAVIYWSYYVPWNGEPWSAVWLHQLTFAVASALYQFAVLGTRYCLPLGIVVLFATSLWLVRTTR